MSTSRASWLWVIYAVAACTEAKPQPGAPPTPSSVTAATLIAQPVLDLGGIRIQISLPAGWSKDAASSDEQLSLAVFKFETPSRNDSLLLDGTREVVMPLSVDNAIERALSFPECEAPEACRELGRAMLSDGGIQISVRRPRAVSVVTWLRASNGRALRCSTEAWDRGEPAPSWLSDPPTLDRVRAEHESACRSIKFLPL